MSFPASTRNAMRNRAGGRPIYTGNCAVATARCIVVRVKHAVISSPLFPRVKDRLGRPADANQAVRRADVHNMAGPRKYLVTGIDARTSTKPHNNERGRIIWARKTTGQ